ncbi:Nuclear pore complex protein, partial [Trichostrongylus colubriformis]
MNIFHDCCNALEYLGSNAVTDEIRHAYGAYRCFAALVTESNLLQEYGIDRGDSFLASLIAEDQDFRLVYSYTSVNQVLWRWCHDGATDSKGFGELAYQIMDIKELSSMSRSYINRTVKGKKVGIDPDSMLSAPEDANFEKLIRVMFSLLRCGRFEEAMKLSGDMSVPWLIPLIRSQQLLMDSSLVSADLTKQKAARFHFRKLFYQTLVKAISETKYSIGIRMVFAALAGDWQFLLPLAVNVDDRIWCYANAAVQARLNAALGIEHPIFAPTTVEGIFEAVATSEPSPYYVLMSFMIRGAWDEAVNWMYSYCVNLEKKPGSDPQSLYRFFGLVTSVFRVLKYDHDEDHGKNLVGRMIDVLLQKELFSLIPLYASLLPNDDALKAIWNVMPFAKSDGDRISFIAALNDAGFDGEQIAFEFGRFRVVEMVDHADHLRWIYACDDKKLVNAVTETNNDWGRCEQLKSLRERCYANMLNMLLRDLGMCDDAETILDVLTELADEELELYK